MIVNYLQKAAKWVRNQPLKKSNPSTAVVLSLCYALIANEAGFAHRRSRSSGVRSVDASLAGS
ncbi:MAG TPA: hypothetical protein VGI59_03910, partial [Candidatus Udaeobacter sp.]